MQLTGTNTAWFLQHGIIGLDDMIVRLVTILSDERLTDLAAQHNLSLMDAAEVALNDGLGYLHAAVIAHSRGIDLTTQPLGAFADIGFDAFSVRVLADMPLWTRYVQVMTDLATMLGVERVIPGHIMLDEPRALPGGPRELMAIMRERGITQHSGGYASGFRPGCVGGRCDADGQFIDASRLVGAGA